MALSGRYHQKSESLRKAREDLAIQKSKDALSSFLQTEQFKYYANSFENPDSVVHKIVETTVKTTLDPVVQFQDTLIAQGFKKAQIRRLVHQLYTTYISGGVDEEKNFEDMIRPVSEFVSIHQELYNTFSVDMLK